MKTNYVAIVFPTLGRSAEQLWSEAAKMLLPGLGKFYSKFSPAKRPWDTEIKNDYGVVFGKDAPEDFLLLYISAKEKLNTAKEYHIDPILEKRLKYAKRFDDTLICPVHLSDEDKALAFHILWNVALNEGALLPDCWLYFAEYKSALVPEDAEKKLLSHVADYAVCVATIAVEGMQE